MYIVFQSKLNLNHQKNITKTRKKSNIPDIKTGIGIQKNWAFGRLKFVGLFSRLIFYIYFENLQYHLSRDTPPACI